MLHRVHNVCSLVYDEALFKHTVIEVNWSTVFVLFILMSKY